MDQTFEVTVSITLKDKGRRPLPQDAERLLHNALTLIYESEGQWDTEIDFVGWGVQDAVLAATNTK